ncbi:S-phase kinase-associated protein 1-like [Toxorhynchites rutilus septentrionalis]|uniref:S-phase kinase-associated protein 1-like n=1 Tax=Toxorhynchites rutilus septentrionalis TaxID=329112 RepID=UPI00247965B2|nr:S-phase kinase-associated protein 1-like [Toxorhynchites rutilus septentrionalis]
MSTIKLQSSDGVIFETDVQAAKCSVTIKTMLEEFGLGESDEPIPLPNLSSGVLQKVLQWAEHHKNDPPLVERRRIIVPIIDEIDPWDAEFFNVDQVMLYELIMAANYLEIKALLDTGCQTVANLIENKSPEEIRATFNIKNDFTSAELEAIHQENELVVMK